MPVKSAWQRLRLLVKSLGSLHPETAAWRRGIRLLYPPRCAFCDADLEAHDDGPLLCQSCREAMGTGQWKGCPRCAAPVSADQEPAQRCRLCRADEFHFDAATALGVYRDAVAQAVLRMKRESGAPLAMTMGGMIASLRDSELALHRADFAVAVPMFWVTRLIRKVNSPDLLATILARSLGIPVLTGLLRRRRKTLPQKSLPPSARFRNVAGSFQLGKGYDIGGARVLLVDDVLTTGATCDAAAAVLKRAGAGYVAVAVLARGVGDYEA